MNKLAFCITLGVWVLCQQVFAATSTDVSRLPIATSNIKQYCCYPSAVTLTPLYSNLSTNTGQYQTMDCASSQVNPYSGASHAAMPATAVNAVFIHDPQIPFFPGKTVGVRCNTINIVKICKWVSPGDCPLSTPNP
jgi:hypothetical protein